jgi:nitroreductase
VLYSAALGLGSLAIGGFLDAQLAALLRLRAGTVPVYALALGPATTIDAEELRTAAAWRDDRNLGSGVV